MIIHELLKFVEKFGKTDDDSNLEKIVFYTFAKRTGTCCLYGS